MESVPGQAYGSNPPVTACIGLQTCIDHAKTLPPSPQRECFSCKAGDLTTGSGWNIRRPKLSLSGNVISATLTLPHHLQHREGNKWGIQQQHHGSAHLDSLQYLSSHESPWNHIVVGWTAEIATAKNGSSFSNQASESTTTGLTPQVSFDSDINFAKTIHIDRGDMIMLEQQLWDEKIRSIPVWLTGHEDVQEGGIRLQNQSRWRSYAEHDLFPAFHYKQHPPTDGKSHDERWKDYYRMNMLFADTLNAIYRPGDIVMVHGHYLMLLPAMLRERRLDIYVVFVLDSPFPTSEIIRCLTKRELLLDGVLGANLVSFQAYHYAQHFMSSCARLIGKPIGQMWVDGLNRRTHIAIFPSGIDLSKIEKMAFSNSVDCKCAELSKAFKDKAIIVGCDPLDRLGGIDKKLAAFELFLSRHGEWIDKVVLLQFTGNSVTMNDDSEDNVAYASKIHGHVSNINSTYGSLSFTPVHLYTQPLSQDDYFAILRMGNVAANTCEREGLSMTSLEYLVCQQEAKGILILSEFSGTAEHLQEALQVNPWDTGKVAECIYEALTSSTKKRGAKHDSLYRRLEKNNVSCYVGNILRHLEQTLSTSQKR